MKALLIEILSDRTAHLRRRAIALGGLLVAANLLAWLWALLAFHAHPLLLGTAAAAYGLGLRHAVDADHIAAIDNVSRKLMQDGRRPLAAGLFFSLGHSTVVLLLTLGIALTTKSLATDLLPLRDVLGRVGVSISALFLFAIAAANGVVFISVYRNFTALRRGERIAPAALEHLLKGGGLIARLCWRLFERIRHSWQMYPLGLLFGLGFDTASEVGLLAISALESSKGMPVVDALVFPVLFLAGMSLIDTVDGMLMLGAYGWAFVKPVRKLYYNMTMTLISVLVAVLVGGIEVLGLIGRELQLQGASWTWLYLVNDHFGLLGYSIIAVFVLSWLGSIAIYRMRGYDVIDITT